jgi:hypothetical protein
VTTFDGGRKTAGRDVTDEVVVTVKVDNVLETVVTTWLVNGGTVVNDTDGVRTPPIDAVDSVRTDKEPAPTNSENRQQQ